MKNLSKMISVALIAMAMVVSGNAFAAAASKASAGSIYGDVKVGYGKVDNTPKTSSADKTNIKRNGMTYGADIGYMFDKQVGVELGYNHFHDVKYTGNKVDDNYAIHLAAKGVMSVGHDMDAYGKLGIARSVQNNKASDLVNTGKNKKYAPYLAVGLQGDLSNNMVWLVDATYIAKKKPVAAKYGLSLGLGFK